MKRVAIIVLSLVLGVCAPVLGADESAALGKDARVDHHGPIFYLYGGHCETDGRRHFSLVQEGCYLKLDHKGHITNSRGVDVASVSFGAKYGGESVTRVMHIYETQLFHDRHRLGPLFTQARKFVGNPDRTLANLSKIRPNPYRRAFFIMRKIFCSGKVDELLKPVRIDTRDPKKAIELFKMCDSFKAYSDASAAPVSAAAQSPSPSPSLSTRPTVTPGPTPPFASFEETMKSSVISHFMQETKATYESRAEYQKTLSWGRWKWKPLGEDKYNGSSAAFAHPDNPWQLMAIFDTNVSGGEVAKALGKPISGLLPVLAHALKVIAPRGNEKCESALTSMLTEFNQEHCSKLKGKASAAIMAHHRHKGVVHIIRVGNMPVATIEKSTGSLRESSCGVDGFFGGSNEDLKLTIDTYDGTLQSVILCSTSFDDVDNRLIQFTLREATGQLHPDVVSKHGEDVARAEALVRYISNESSADFQLGFMNFSYDCTSDGFDHK